jgi:hypothetical protein
MRKTIVAAKAGSKIPVSTLHQPPVHRNAADATGIGSIARCEARSAVGAISIDAFVDRASALPAEVDASSIVGVGVLEVADGPGAVAHAKQAVVVEDQGVLIREGGDVCDIDREGAAVGTGAGDGGDVDRGATAVALWERLEADVGVADADGGGDDDEEGLDELDLGWW